VLQPAPNTLGLAGPVLGPWFSEESLTLGRPSADGSVSVKTNNDPVMWYPPANGLLTYHEGAASAALYAADGSLAAFEGTVAVFRVMPEAEPRLHRLLRRLPRADDGTVDDSARRRAEWRYLALAAPPGDDLGLGKPVSETGVQVARPNVVTVAGQSTGSRTQMASLRANATYTLWAFDVHGRPIDPGAVAAWLARLAEEFPSMWADGLNDSEKRTVDVDPARTVHLTNLHGGPAFANTVPGLVPEGRIALDNANPVDGASTLHAIDDASKAVTVRVTDAPSGAPDDAPVPRLALAADGTFGADVETWPDGWATDPGLVRDFVRVVVTDVEGLLVGQRRATPAGSGPIDRRQAENQNRRSTRVKVARSPGPVLLDDTDAVAEEVLGLFGGGDPVTFVSGTLDADYGPFPVAPLPDALPPDALPDVTATAVDGEGVLLEWDLSAGETDPALAGAWVRVWTTPASLDDGRRRRMTGGAGRVRDDGVVSVLVPVVGGDPGEALDGVDVAIQTQQGQTLYFDERFERPDAAGGSAADFTTLADDTEILVPEVGLLQAKSAVADGSLPPGVTVVARPAATGTTGDPPAPQRVDRTTLPATLRPANTIVNAARSTDAIFLTEPAYADQDEGTAQGLITSGPTVERTERGSLAAPVTPGHPLPSQQRRECLATAHRSDAAAAVIGTTSARSHLHESDFANQGHPGVPAAPETHGAGAVLGGPAAALAAEVTRDRAHPWIHEIAQAATTPLPTPTLPGGAHRWAAVLRTVAAGVETEAYFDPDTVFGANNPYPFGQTLDQLRDWLVDKVDATSLPNAPGTLEADLKDAVSNFISENRDHPVVRSLERALDRRVLLGSYGGREGLTSLLAAVRRAERLIYVETPALDNLQVRVHLGGSATASVSLFEALIDRLKARPGLRLLIALPLSLPDDVPKALDETRRALLQDVADAFEAHQLADASDRVVAFVPAGGPGRGLHLASTTVVVDDVYALVGTTHLWRRGLSFDSSVSVAVCDERLDGGVGPEIADFRRRAVAGRLSVPPASVPADAVELCIAVRRLVAQGGLGRLAATGLPTPDPDRVASEVDVWNRDGAPANLSNLFAWITGLSASHLSNDAPT
jgi:hypothetical protein